MPTEKFPSSSVESRPTRRRTRRIGRAAVALGAAVALVGGTAACAPGDGPDSVKVTAAQPSQPSSSEKAASSAQAIAELSKQQINLLTATGAENAYSTVREVGTLLSDPSTAPTISHFTEDGQETVRFDASGAVGDGGSQQQWYEVAGGDHSLTVSYGAGEVGTPDSSDLRLTFSSPTIPTPDLLEGKQIESYLNGFDTAISGMESSIGTQVYNVSIDPAGHTIAALTSGSDTGANAPQDGRHNLQDVIDDQGLMDEFLTEMMTGQVAQPAA